MPPWRHGVVNAQDGSHLFLIVVAPKAQALCDGSGEIATRVALSLVNNVFAPKYTVTQYLAAPVVCSDFRSDCIEPLDQTSPFLPPEMRLRDIDWRHVPDRMSVEVKRLLFSGAGRSHSEPAQRARVPGHAVPGDGRLV